MKRKFLQGLAVCVMVFGITALANAALVADENFESGATGWTDNTISYGANFSYFLGRFSLDPSNAPQVASKTFTLSGNQTAVNIDFDFYEIDSWDGEVFKVSADGNVLTDQLYWTSWGYASYDPLPGTDLGFAFYADQIHHFSFIYNTTAASLTLSFESTLNQPVPDESWGIDNLRITAEAIPVPEPAFLLFLGAGLSVVGLTARRNSK
jgi:large repetitive protein